MAREDVEPRSHTAASSNGAKPYAAYYEQPIAASIHTSNREGDASMTIKQLAKALAAEIALGNGDDPVYTDVMCSACQPTLAGRIESSQYDNHHTLPTDDIFIIA